MSAARGIEARACAPTRPYARVRNPRAASRSSPPGRARCIPARATVRPRNFNSTTSPFCKLLAFASAGLMRAALSHVSFVTGFASSCSQALLSNRPSQSSDPARKTSSRLWDAFGPVGLPTGRAPGAIGSRGEISNLVKAMGKLAFPAGPRQTAHFRHGFLKLGKEILRGPVFVHDVVRLPPG